MFTYPHSFVIIDLSNGKTELIMKTGKFTKHYEAQPNEKQRESLTKAFKTLAEGFLMFGKNVTVTVSEANDNSVFAVLECGNFYDTKLIGPRGGIKTL